ncbi:hypothetical protein V1224_03600 [Lachnospiraceae bacterium JLR.KK008]
MFGTKYTGARSGRSSGQVSSSIRGAESTELTSVKVNNEVAFCKVYNLKQKEEIEKLLLKNRISYFVKWQEQKFFKRMFDSESKEKIIFVICIHDTAIEQAKELVGEMPDVKMLVP